MDEWYYANHGKAVGPISQSVIRDWVKQGAIRPTQMVCREGGTTWATLESFPELMEGVRPPEPAFVPSAAPRPDVKCQRHPEATAVHLCVSCRKGVCGTCDFSLPSGAHACPSCAMALPGSLGSRAQFVFVAACLSGLSLLLLIILVFHFAHRNYDNADQIMMVALYFGVVPGFVGAGLSLAGIEKRLNNPLIARSAAIGCNVVLALWIVLFLWVATERGSSPPPKPQPAKTPPQNTLVWRS